MTAFSSSAYAQAPKTITFDQAVGIALDENTQIRRSENDVDLQEVRTTQEWMSFAPNLNLSTSATRSFGRSFSQEEGEILIETSDFFELGADVSASLVSVKVKAFVGRWIGGQSSSALQPKAS